jgi:hypothetical protein
MWLHHYGFAKEVKKFNGVWWRCSNGSYFPFVWLSKLCETSVVLDRDDNNSHLKKINIHVNHEAIGEFELNL